MELATNIVKIDGSPVYYDLIRGKDVKMTKDGKPKMTKNNNSKDRKVDPIKDREDIERCKVFLKNRISSTTREDYKRGYARDLMLFVIGINTFYRVSDLLEMRWNGFFTKNGRFRDYYVTKEIKTGKVRRVYINDSIKEAIGEYLTVVVGVDKTSDDYVFTNRQGNKLSDTSVDSMMKMLQRELNLPYRLSTHSLRKTGLYAVYLKSDKDIALVSELAQHSNTSVTKRYLGITDDTLKKAYLDLNL